VLPRRFYARPTLEVARDLIGKVLVCRTVRGTTAGMIVETEAYIGESDPACHASSGKTKRNAPLYGPPGHAYVYFSYGMHWLVNAVTEPDGVPAAVLIRALDPLEGLDLMRHRRGRRTNGREFADHDLCRGPGNVTKAMGIGALDNCADLTRVSRAPETGESGPGLWIEDRGISAGDVAWTGRIGISVGTDAPWRCSVAHHPAVSGGRGRVRATRAGAAPDAGRGRGTRSSVPPGRRRS
jgi:DNA-3-methyladenine glycosylase